jgi:murein DD-endopeptidase MepM/ murein hydrolase activator NlpD
MGNRNRRTVPAELAQGRSLRYCLRGRGMLASLPGFALWGPRMKPIHVILNSLGLVIPFAAVIPAVGFALNAPPPPPIPEETLLAARPQVKVDKLWVKARQPIGVADLSRQLELPVDSLSGLNDVDADHRFKVGDWIILPGQNSRQAKQLPSLDTTELRRTAPPIQAPPAIQEKGIVQLGETLLVVAQRYGTTMQEILRLNPSLDTAKLVAGTEIQLVQATPKPRQRAVLALKPTTSGGLSWPTRSEQTGSDASFDDRHTKTWIWPTKGVFTSGYGWRWGRMHRGIDLANNVGTPILAARTGRVVFSGWHDGGYGYLVKLQHPDGSQSIYAHNSRLMVKSGQQVRQGTVIAKMGSTGRSTGPHLHFEIHPAKTGASNPLQFLPSRA